MNIFVLSNDPAKAAQMQCDRHIIKMTLESAQMLSTAHRVLDGDQIRQRSKSGLRHVTTYRHPDSHLDQVLYKSVHVNHPCTVWTRQSSANYNWHYQHFIALCNEFTYRYGKIHKTDRQLRFVLARLPENIPQSSEFTPMPLAMFDECKVSDNVVECYRNYYQTKQNKFNVQWTRRHAPDWFQFHNEGYVL